MLDMYGVNENIPPPTSAELNHFAPGRNDSVSSDAHGEKAAIASPAEIPLRGRTLQRAADIVPRPYKSNNAVSSESSLVKSIKPDDTVPKETAMPPVTPKRQIRLATSNSSAAEWFATGPINDKKKESKESEISIADLQSLESEEKQTILESPAVPETAVVYLLEPSHMESESEPCTSQSATEDLLGKYLLTCANY
jgi:hypothetical protein